MKKYLLLFLLAFSFLYAQPTPRLISQNGTQSTWWKIGNGWIEWNVANTRWEFANNIAIDSGKTITSQNFVSGWAGSGFRLLADTNSSGKWKLEIDELTVRGTLSVYELLARQIRASNGNVFISDIGKVQSIYSDTVIVIKDVIGNGVCALAANDLIKTQRFDNDGTSIRNVEATVNIIYPPGTLGLSDVVVSVAYNTATHFQAGDDVVRVGNTTNTARQASIHMASTDANAPFFDMINGVNSWGAWAAAAKTKLRIGNLGGITDASFGGALSGYGLYAQNVYLKGNFIIANPQEVADTLANYLDTTTTVNSVPWDSVLNKPSYFAAPSGSGLFLSATYMGYYAASAWKTYMDNAGNFVFGNISGGGAGISWTQATAALSIKGSVNLTNSTTFVNGGALSLDDVGNGATYEKVLATDITAGHILLSETTGSLDDIDDGSSYGRVVVTDLSSGHILLSTTVGDLDDIADGTGYAKVKATYISSGRILLSEAAGDLDDIDDGDTYGKIAATDISSGHITLISSSAALNINSTTYGNDGIQLQYNGGNPRAYIGDGANQYFKFDGTNVSWKGTNSELTAAGAFTATNATITGTVTITNPTTFNNGNPLNTSDLTNNSSWDNTSTALTSGVSLSAGGIVLGTNAVIRSGQTAYNTGTGYWLGVVSGTPKFSIGNSSDNRVTWDGSTLTIAGALNTGTGSSIDGQFVNSLAANKITAGTGIVNNLSVLSTLTMGSAATDGYIQSYGWNGTANGFQIKGGPTPAISLIGGTYTGGTFRTAASGARTQIDYSNNLAFFNSSDTFIGGLHPNPSDANGIQLSSTSDISIATSTDIYLSASNISTGATIKLLTDDYPSVNLYGLSTTSIATDVGMQFGDGKFIITNGGSLTKVNNTAASSVKGYFLKSDGTSFNPGVLTSSDLPVSSDINWTADHTWTQAVSGSYYLTLTNSETSNTSAVGGFYMKANQGGSAGGAAFQVFSSQYSDATVAGKARLRTDNALTGIIYDMGNASGLHSFRINATEYAKVTTNGITASKFYVSSINTAPASAGSTGTAGEIRFGADYIYVCTATNTWERVAIATW